jgi:hypothetical protein
MERIGYLFLTFVALAWFTAMIWGLIEAFPYGIIGLIGIAGLGLLFIKIARDRLASKEDDYYSKRVDR